MVGTKKETTVAVILLQIAMVSTGTHFIKIMSPSPKPMSPSPKASESYNIKGAQTLTEP